MFVKGVRKHISTFCLPEKEKKKTEKDNNRSWHNSTCHENDLLNFICVFLVWSGPYLNLHKWVLNFSECKFIRFYAYLMLTSVSPFVLNASFGRYLWQESFYDDILLVY